jgi:ribonuclease Z
VLSVARTVAPDARPVLCHAYQVRFGDKLRFAGVRSEAIEHYRQQVRARAARQLHALADAAGLREGDWDACIVEGEASSCLLEQELARDCDLAVQGKHGHGAVQDLLLGGVTQHVLARGPPTCWWPRAPDRVEFEGGPHAASPEHAAAFAPRRKAVRAGRVPARRCRASRNGTTGAGRGGADRAAPRCGRSGKVQTAPSRARAAAGRASRALRPCSPTTPGRSGPAKLCARGGSTAPCRRSMRQLFHPCLVNGGFGDPALHVDVGDERRALLFDIGDLGALPPRKLLRVSHVFVSHAHMDHFAGFDHLLRVVLGRKARVVLCGGPGFVAQVEHKLRAYTWNVVQRYAVELVIDVREIDPLGRGQRACFSSRTGFARAARVPFELHHDVLLDETTFRVRGRFVDHGTPCLAFAVEEKARVRVAKDRLAALGVSTGAWLRELKRAVLAGAPAGTPIRMCWRDRRGDHEMTRSVGELRDVVLDVAPGQRLGYATDLRFSASNVGTLVALLAGVDRLFIESVFLEADADHAARKNHLTARQAGEVARRVGARSVVPFHFSPRYEGRAAALIAEVQAAWAGVPTPGDSPEGTGGRTR